MDADAFPRLIQSLLRPDAYPHEAPAPLGRLETHISHVLLAGDFAYKLKKPVDLGFLDFSTLERRRHCCEEEVRLNRRLAPELYLGVVPITGTPERPRVGGTGAVLEYAVQMHRFEQETLLDRCPLTPELVERIAARIAAFHAQVPRADPGGRFGTPAAVLEPMLENLTQVRALVTAPAVAQRLDRLTEWTLERWQTLTPVIEQRRAQGRVRECHGDLHRGNIAQVDGEPLFFDALEFNPNLRWIDTASELAFLIMDLDGAGASALARRLLNQYLALGGDYGALAVLDLYLVYRAMVRAKVLAIRAHQADLPAGEAATQQAQCLRHLDLAESYTRRRRPRLLLVCGLSGSGKSRLAGDLSEALPAIHLRSDIERKRLFGLTAAARSGKHFGSGIYFPAATEWTYQRLHALTGAILANGYDVLVDATFLTRARRAVFRDLARRQGAGFAVLALLAPMAVLRTRVACRLAAGLDASEATVAVLERQARTCERLSRSERRTGMTINSTERPPLDEILERIAALTAVPIGE
ncbi:bifunctional aminoglycoside phosphotransferase/ATP-binding protein [uncultured Thiodictyon sp.]|uniref:bifunctional aminoglycoside phosphotransferase/ATP-binding protein n=1 Tax=uncultured Thiodictyon sp. TaxID=1846217 RepID=UPI0025D241D5|nr:bifunctional aminoglycoside phosphotransferase/ATP-binding protein [uncultured Thiodictyon sp.]